MFQNLEFESPFLEFREGQSGFHAVQHLDTFSFLKTIQAFHYSKHGFRRFHHAAVEDDLVEAWNILTGIHAETTTLFMRSINSSR